MVRDAFSQGGYRCRLEWGRRGAAYAAERADILVVVDVLSFSSAVATATHRGAHIIPCRDKAESLRVAEQRNGVIAAVNRDAGGSSAYSLSPVSYTGISAGAIVALPSPNGAACCLLAAPDTKVYAGCFLNASAVASRVRACLQNSESSVTVLACGERWEEPHEEGTARFAIEDFLGAGAILSELPFSKSPEAQVCAAAFRAVQDDLQSTIWNCCSGLELRGRGYPQDVQHASMWNMYDTAPVLRRGQFETEK